MPTSPARLHVAGPLKKAHPQSPGAFARAAGQTAVRALLCEVSVTPKPGLVDRANSGAHKDMDFFTFVRSALALGPYFEEVTLLGYSFDGPAEALLPRLRPAGLAAEAAMLKATCGINTHKGLIFTLGILCAGLGWLQKHQGDCGTSTELLDTAAKIAYDVCGELGSAAQSNQPTKGALAYGQHRVTGIRREIAAGLPHVRHCGYPALKQALAAGQSLNAAAIAALLALMAQVEDTNIIGRGGLAALHSLQSQVAARLAQGGTDLAAFAARLDAQMTRQNLSPGGSADLLAVCLFLHFWFH